MGIFLYHVPSDFILFFETRSFTEPRTHWLASVGKCVPGIALVAIPPHPVLGVQECNTMPSFYVGAEGFELLRKKIKIDKE